MPLDQFEIDAYELTIDPDEIQPAMAGCEDCTELEALAEAESREEYEEQILLAVTS
jgi:hypothetical protein